MNFLSNDNIKYLLQKKYVIAASWFILTGFFGLLPFWPLALFWGVLARFIFFIPYSILFVSVLYRGNYSKRIGIAIVVLTMILISIENSFAGSHDGEFLVIFPAIIFSFSIFSLLVASLGLFIRKYVNPSEHPTRLNWLFIIPIILSALALFKF